LFILPQQAEKNLPKISNLDIKIDGGKYDAKVRLYLPHDFNERNKYPLLVNVYAGPNSQQVPILQNDIFLDQGLATILIRGQHTVGPFICGQINVKYANSKLTI